MDFAEFFTTHARKLVPLAWRKDLLLLFDFQGPFLRVDADARLMHQALQRPALAALELLHDGFIFMSAQAQLHDGQTADLSISIAGTGLDASDDQITDVLKQLDLLETPGDGDAAGDARVARGRCPFTGAAVSFAASRTDGILFGLDIRVPVRAIDRKPAPNAEGARAWLISNPPRGHESLLRRLQRLGWATSAFTTVQQAVDHFNEMTPSMARPALVVASESPAVTVDSVRELRNLLPSRTRLVLATASDSSTQLDDSDIELRHWPLSPGDLYAFTRQACDDADTLSGQTLPAPLAFTDRPRALVVDDNPVNLLVARGLLQVAGYEVDTVSGGEEAVVLCQQRPPSVVLMDVHMPGMDGLQATRLLREMQQKGRLPPFAIVAATADAMEIGEHACYAAGMDGYLSKPLSLQAIRQELLRVVPGSGGATQ